MNSNLLKKSIFPLILVCTAVYLFVTAPPPIQEEMNQEKKSYSINEALTIIAELNDAARTFYTKQIVGNGLKVGLKFDEYWQKSDVEAGPLPALFLRGISRYLEKSKVPMGLYLGSDFPIVKNNLFEGEQAVQFKKIRKDKKSKFFFDEDTKRYVAMFPDFAGAAACVSCHNEHENSPKKDWKLNDIMGATTWTYPTDSVSTDELKAMINVYRGGVTEVFNAYLKEAKSFTVNPVPNIGNNWPVNGYNIPDIKTFNDTLDKLTSRALLLHILKAENEK